MPHINLLYPFYADEHFDSIAQEVSVAIQHIAPFDIHFSPQVVQRFTHGRSSTFWWKPLVSQFFGNYLKELFKKQNLNTRTARPYLTNVSQTCKPVTSNLGNQVMCICCERTTNILYSKGWVMSVIRSYVRVHSQGNTKGGFMSNFGFFAHPAIKITSQQWCLAKSASANVAKAKSILRILFYARRINNLTKCQVVKSHGEWKYCVYELRLLCRGSLHGYRHGLKG